MCSDLCEFEPAASCSFQAVLGLFFGKKCTGQNCGQNRGENQKLCTVTKKRPIFKVLSLKIGRFLVGMTGFEPATSWSQTKRATNCATSRSIKLWSKLKGLQNWSKLWSNVIFAKQYMQKFPCLYRFLSVGISNGTKLPNHPLYQLSHTPILYWIFKFLRRSGTNCGQSPFLRFFEILQSAENPHK